MNIKAACSCNMGLVRENNEDNFYFHGKMLPKDHSNTETLTEQKISSASGALFAVFDGMGGEQNGEEASYLAAKVLKNKRWSLLWQRNIVDLLKTICLKANEEICKSMRAQRLSRMGSTAAILCVLQDQLWVCNIGDSRIYRIRDGEICRASHDHTNQAFLEQHGIFNRKPHLTQHLGIFPEEMMIDPYIAEQTVKDGDRYILCSDGLTDMLSEEEIRHISMKYNAADAVSQLVQGALDRGGRDNITVIVCDFSI